MRGAGEDAAGEDAAGLPVVHFTGSGSTGLIAGLLAHRLRRLGPRAQAVPVDPRDDPAGLPRAPFWVIGTPSYHNLPAQSLLDVLARVPAGGLPRRAFLFSTCGLYAGNTLRVLARALAARGVRTQGHAGFRGPASDSAALVPLRLRFLMSYEAGIAGRIAAAAERIADLATRPDAPDDLPPARWYAVLDHLPNRVIARRLFRQRLAPRLALWPARWTGAAVDCPRGCWAPGPAGRPVCAPGDCDFCLRCVHATPNAAVAARRGMRDAPRLDAAFYRDWEGRIRAELDAIPPGGRTAQPPGQPPAASASAASSAGTKRCS